MVRAKRAQLLVIIYCIFLQSSTPDIAVSGGQVLVDGTITGYLVSLDSGNNVHVTCSNSTCSTSLTTELPVGRSGFTLSVAAINSLGRGPSDQAACKSMVKAVITQYFG